MNDIKEYINPLRPEEAGQTMIDKGGYDNIGEKLVPLDLSDALALIGRMEADHLAALAEKDEQLRRARKSETTWLTAYQEKVRGMEEQIAALKEDFEAMARTAGLQAEEIATLTAERDNQKDTINNLIVRWGKAVRENAQLKKREKVLIQRLQSHGDVETDREETLRSGEEKAP